MTTSSNRPVSYRTKWKIDLLCVTNMGYQQQQPTLRSFRRWMCLILFISLLSLPLLLWAFRPARTVQFWNQYYRPTQTQIPDQPTPTGCVPGCLEPHGEKAPPVAVNRTHTLLVSAYLEHRSDRREVRVIAVVLRDEAVAYRCHLCCQGQCHISAGDASVHWDHFRFAYGTADIMCPLPSGCETPSHIALTSVDAADSEGKVYLEVLNQEVRSDSFNHNFTVCLSTMFDFTNVLQLVQSMAVLQLLGVSRVVVYKTSCSPDTQRLLDYYTHTGFMEVIPWSMSSFLNVSRGWQPEYNPGDLHYYGQIPALNDCVYRYMYQSRYLALHDMDELILPQSADSWGELLLLLEQKHGADYCYMFENNVFPTSVTLPPPSSQSPPPPKSGWQGVSGVNILAHLHHEPVDKRMFSNFKIIVNPRAVFAATVHGLLKSQKGCVIVDSEVARMYHTRAPVQTQLTPDQLIYDDRLLSYRARLTLAVNTVLKKTRLIPEESTE